MFIIARKHITARRMLYRARVAIVIGPLGCGKGGNVTSVRTAPLSDIYHCLVVCLVWVCLVCDSDDSSLSATNDNCSPRWIVHYQSRGTGGGATSLIRSVTSPQLCLKACVDSKRCIIAHWTRKAIRGCYLYYWRSRRRWYRHEVTQFEIVRQCNNSSGTWSHKLVIYHLFIT